MTHQEGNHNELKKLLLEMNERLDSIEGKVDPMYELFTNAKGFDNISKWLMVNLVKLAAAVAVVYGLIKWLKN